MQKRRFQHAFTLVEAIVAIVVLSVAMPSMLWAIKEAQLVRASPVLASKARWLAQEQLENIIADRHSPSRGFTYLQNSNYPLEASVPGFSSFSRQVAITETGARFLAGGTGYKTVTVVVGWTDPRAGQRSLSLSTVVSDYLP